MYFSLKVDFPALKFQRSPGIFQDAFPRSEISGNPSYCGENKFLQYDLWGSGLQRPDKNVELVLPNSAALVLLLFHVPYVSCSILCQIKRR